MKIFRIRSVFNAAGNFAYKQVSHKEGGYDELCAQFEAGKPLSMEWAWGCKSKKLADFVPTTSSGLLFTNRVMEKMQAFFPCAKRYQVKLKDGQSLSGIAENNYPAGSLRMDHVFYVYPKHSYPVVSEAFKFTWEENGFTGMTFEAVGEIDDAAFVPVSAI